MTARDDYEAHGDLPEHPTLRARRMRAEEQREQERIYSGASEPRQGWTTRLHMLAIRLMPIARLLG